MNILYLKAQNCCGVTTRQKSHSASKTMRGLTKLTINKKGSISNSLSNSLSTCFAFFSFEKVEIGDNENTTTTQQLILSLETTSK